MNLKIEDLFFLNIENFIRSIIQIIVPKVIYSYEIITIIYIV